MADPWSVFDDDDDNTTVAAKPETIEYNSAYGPKFLSLFQDGLVEFIQDGLQQMYKDLAEKQQTQLGTAVKKAFIAFKIKQWKVCEESSSFVDSFCWSALEGHKWDHVAWREAYIYSQLMLITLEVLKSTPDQSNLKKAIKRADLAIIMGAPPQKVNPMADFIEKKMDLSKINKSHNLPPMSSFKFTKQSLPNLPQISPSQQIKIEENLTIEDFKNKYFQPGVPCIIRGQMTQWPGIEKWTNMEYLMSQYGHRTVPIELGKHNSKNHGKWKEELLTIGEFIEKYIIPSSECVLKGETIAEDKIAYLAQHHLFDQLDQLAQDIEIPPYAASCGEVANINAWFGTSSTTTPLHYDSYHNCLAQVFGYKYIRLYLQTETPKLYVHEINEENKNNDASVAQGNISQVNVEDYDKSQYPLFSQAQYTETLLCPGDILFLPANVWHYVRSCSPSFSVSFWFE